MHAHARTLARTHTRSHERTHARTHIHTYIHTVFARVLSGKLKPISFFIKQAGRLASTIARTPMTIIPHMMAYVSVFTELI